jgi:hypothetical protein
MTAQDAYASAITEALELMDKIRLQIEDLPAIKDDINWGHVADVSHLVDMLHEIAQPEGDCL